MVQRGSPSVARYHPHGAFVQPIYMALSCGDAGRLQGALVWLSASWSPVELLHFDC